jgi:hypothetical protein
LEELEYQDDRVLVSGIKEIVAISLVWSGGAINVDRWIGRPKATDDVTATRRFS